MKMMMGFHLWATITLLSQALKSNAQNVYSTFTPDAAPIRERSPSSPKINYGGIHPFEQGSQNKRRTQLIEEEDTAELYKPLRIHLDTTGLEKFLIINDSSSRTEKINTLMQTILPDALLYWTSTLKVIPVEGNLFIGKEVNEARSEGRYTNCPILFQDPPHSHSVDGVPNTDIVIYVDPGGPECDNSKGTVLPYALVCELDQFDRPIAGKYLRKRHI